MKTVRTYSSPGLQYVSIRYTERLVEAGIEPSVGSKGDSYDNALAETSNGTRHLTRPSPSTLEAQGSGGVGHRHIGVQHGSPA